MSDEIKLQCGPSCTACSDIPATGPTCTVSERVEWEPIEMHAASAAGSLVDEIQKAGISSGVSYANRGNGERVEFSVGPTGFPRPMTDVNGVIQRVFSPSGVAFYRSCAENPAGTYTCLLSQIYRTTIMDSAGNTLRV